MHEMSLAAGIVDLALEEMRSRNASGIERIEVEYGALSGIMPEALEMAFHAQALARGIGRARLMLKRIPLRMQCNACGAEFGGDDTDAIWQGCPSCGEELGYRLLQGRELVLKRIYLDV